MNVVEVRSVIGARETHLLLRGHVIESVHAERASQTCGSANHGAKDRQYPFRLDRHARSVALRRAELSEFIARCRHGVDLQ